MKNLFLFALFVVISSATCYSQELLEFAPNIGRFNAEEFELNKYEKDTTAEAVVLYDRGKTTFREYENSNFIGFHIVFQRTQRIKILKNSGISWATFEIPFYVNGNEAEEIEDIKGFTYNTVGKQYEKTPLDVKTIYEENQSSHWKIKKFAMPNVKEGSIVEIAYIISSPYLFNFRSWNYQKRIPVIYSEYVTHMIPFYTYNYLLQGASKFDDFASIQDNNTRTFSSAQFNDMIYKFVMKDIPAFKDEAFITCPQDFIIKQDFQLCEHSDVYGVKTSYVNTWPKFIKELLKTEELGGYLKDASAAAKKQISTLNLASKPSIEKIQTIDAYLKSNFNWNKHVSMYASNDFKKFAESKTGNVAEINLYYVGLLKAAGVDAFPVILSTRDHGKIQVDYPFEHFFNYVVAAARIDGKLILFDATDSFDTFGMLPVGCINDKGLALVSDKEMIEWVNLGSTTKSTNSFTIDLKPDVNTKSIKAYFRVMSNGYYANDYRNQYSSDPDKFKKEFLPSSYTLKDSIKVSNALETTKALNISFFANGNLNTFDDKISFAPFCSFVESVNPLQQPTRTYPIDMTYRKEMTFQTVIHIPDGYKVLNAPANTNIDNDEVRIQLLTENMDGGVLKISASFEFKKDKYPSDKYDDLKFYYRRIVDLFNEEVVLKKI